jgi:hypothetical protein
MLLVVGEVLGVVVVAVVVVAVVVVAVVVVAVVVVVALVLVGVRLVPSVLPAVEGPTDDVVDGALGVELVAGLGDGAERSPAAAEDVTGLLSPGVLLDAVWLVAVGELADARVS